MNNIKAHKHNKPSLSVKDRRMVPHRKTTDLHAKRRQPAEGTVRNNNTRRPAGPPRKVNWSLWMYRHRVGLLVTAVVYLVAAIVFMTYKIVVIPSQNFTAVIEMEFPVEEKQPELTPEEIAQIEKEKEIERLEEARYRNVQNRISDQNAKLNAGIRDSKGTDASKIYEEAQRVQDMLAEGRQAAADGEAGLQSHERQQKEKRQNQSNESGGKRGGSENSENKSEFVKGNVTVSYDLEGRTAVYLHIPAYECQGGGKVMVSITVNRSGKVTAASVNKSTASNDNCIQEMAVKAALASTFSASSTAPDKQKGTITYIFIPQ